MTSARRLYRLVAALAAAGVAAVFAGAVAATARTTLGLPSADTLAAACRRLLPSGAVLPALPILALGALGLVVLVRGSASGWRRARAERRFRRRVETRGRVAVAGQHVTLVEDLEPDAYCVGYLRPRVHLSTGALDRLSDAELEAVAAHERHHAARRDPLRLLIARVLADALFFLPGLRRLGDRYAALAELAADEAAARASGTSTVASAMLAFNRSPRPELVVGIAPERVDHLLGERPRWELPASLFIGAVVTLAGVLAVVALVLSLRGARVDVGLFLTQGCMAVMCVAGLATAGVAAVVARRRLG
jgi:Zn-dependent protease with chaperone function